MAQSNRSSSKSLGKQAIAKAVSRVAEEVLRDPKKEADAHPLVIQALESVIGLLQKKATQGSELEKTLSAAKAAVDASKYSGRVKG
jgi:hypothetical protein